MKAWHFLRDDGLLRDGTAPPEDGVPLCYHGPIKLCAAGLHYSLEPLDALKYAPGALVCRVDVNDLGYVDDKGVTNRRTILWRADATHTLHEFSVECACDALEQVDDPDLRSVNALKVKLDWLEGTATDKKLATARAAAWAATRDATRAATGAAAWAVARDAAWAAAWAVARDAAWAVARAAQNARLTEMLEELKP